MQRITCRVNGLEHCFEGNPKTSLLTWLRRDLRLCAAKDGCSGQGVCGACLVEVNGKATLACATSMAKLQDSQILTLEGFPSQLKLTLATAFINQGAVQCGFCTPGFLTRAKILLDQNPNPSREDVVKAVRPHLCRCTGYIPLVDAILDAARSLRQQKKLSLCPDCGMGHSWPKYGGLEKALALRPFMDDLTVPGMVHGALVFSAHPRAKILKLPLAAARKLPNVLGVFGAREIPGKRHMGMFVKDWPLYIKEGEITRSVCDVLALVVAPTREQAREAAAKLGEMVEYQVLEAITSMEEAQFAPFLVHEHIPANVLVKKTICRGPDTTEVYEEDIDEQMALCAHKVTGFFTTPPIEHAFLETEASLAIPRHCAAWGTKVLPESAPLPNHAKLQVFSQGQGIWHDRDDIASLLHLYPDDIVVSLIDAGGGFGGKEDLTVQGHAALAAYLLNRPVMVRLTRPESLRMHPKRHAMNLAYTLGCDKQGKLQAAKVKVLADAGAYASVSSAVVVRTGTHATSVYHIPFVHVEVKGVLTNNIPAGAFRGFGVNQSNFAMESMVDELCSRGGFDPWQFRYDNAVEAGKMVTTGQILGQNVAIKECLLAVKDAYLQHPHAGIACAIKNSGIGNGIPEPSTCIISVDAQGALIIDHGWTEMGQGINTVARQILCETLFLHPSVPIQVRSCTSTGAEAGSTTASRGTYQLGHTVLDAAQKMLKALGLTAPIPSTITSQHLLPLAGQTFSGHYDSVGQTSEQGPPGTVRNHVSYSFACHVAQITPQGRIEKIIAAHDSGKVVNPALFNSQVMGGVAMAIGYAITENFPQRHGYLASERFKDCGILRATDMPEIQVIAVEKADKGGPLGAKGVGEISCVPSTAAIANAMAKLHHVRHWHLPMGLPPPDPTVGLGSKS